MTRNLITEIECDAGCGNVIHAPAKKGFFGYKKANYPESWIEIQEDMCCEKCSGKILDAMRKAKDSCRNNGGRKKSSTA